MCYVLVCNADVLLCCYFVTHSICGHIMLRGVICRHIMLRGVISWDDIPPCGLSGFRPPLTTNMVVKIIFCTF